MPKRTMPICFTREEVKILEEYARAKGMLNISQAVEEIVNREVKE